MMRRTGVVLVGAVVVVGVTAVSGCSGEQRSAAGPVASAVSASASSSLVAEAEGPPGEPRVSWKSAGHVVTLSLQPGPGSTSVRWFETAVAKQGEIPDIASIERCPLPAGDGEVTQCPVTLKRGNWDVFVRAVNDAGNSAWLESASAGPINSCTDDDAASGVCEVGDTGPGGGYVFYDAKSRQSWGQFLEAAPPGWSGKPNDVAKWWCPSKQPGWNAVLATSDAIGTGAANTQLIIENCGSDTAAGLAAAYRGGGKTDWSLPSRDELTAMYGRRNEIPGLTLRNDYWTSSQSQAADLNQFASERDFSDGSEDNGQKDASWGFYVHPVRAF